MKKVLIFAVAGILAMFTSQANAALMLSIDDSGTVGVGADVVVTDQGAGDMNNGATQVDNILVSTTIGSWTVVVEIGLSDGVLGINRMDLNNTGVSNAAGTLTIALTDENFGGPGYVLAIGGTTNGSVTASVYTGANNTPFDLGSLVASVGPLGSGAFSGTGSGSAAAGPHQLTVVATITHGAGIQITTFDAEVSPVPEPASLTLLGMGALGMMGYVARRRKTAA